MMTVMMHPRRACFPLCVGCEEKGPLQSAVNGTAAMGGWVGGLVGWEGTSCPVYIMSMQSSVFWALRGTASCA